MQTRNIHHIGRRLGLWFLGLGALGGLFLAPVAHAQSGSVYTWGYGSDGELGNGTTTSSSSPVQVVGVGGIGNLTGIKSVANGAYHSMALKNDGTVYAWGYNLLGTLGDGTTTDRSTPVQVVGVGGIGNLTKIKAIAAGTYHSLALNSDGTVSTWGYNFYGNLGNGTTTDSLTPITVMGVGGIGNLTGIKSIHAGYYTSVALKHNGTVYAWGYNGFGELGDGTTTDSYTPIQVVGVGGIGNLTGIKSVSVGYNHTLALKGDGTVYAWGDNTYNQLGDGTTTSSSTPIQVVGVGGIGNLTGIKAIAAGAYQSFALKSDGTVYAWGYNGSGELGNGTTTDSSTPVQVVGVGGTGFLTGIKSIHAGYESSVALKSDGTVYTWGYNYYSSLGDGTTTNSSTPVQVVGVGGTGVLTGIQSVELSTNAYHIIAVAPQSTLTTTGRNNSRQLGDNTGVDKNSPVNVVNVANPIGLAAGVGHSLALLPNGTAKAWGHNGYGQCATGNTVSVTTPTALSLTHLIAVSAGTWHTLFLKDDGTVQAAGYNPFGQLGDGSNTNRSSPVSVSGLTGIIAVSGGGNHSLALDSAGGVWAWGNNTYGQLGNSSNSDSNLPVAVTLPEVAVAISAGLNHSLALGVSGTLYAWGYNLYGQLGDGTRVNRNAPVLVQSGIISLSAGNYHSLALDSGGTALAWGRNDTVQVGDGTTANRSTPQSLGSGYVGVAAGGYHSLGLTDTGLANVWGLNSFGQLGDGTNLNRSTPTALGSVYSLLAGGWYHSFLLP